MHSTQIIHKLLVCILCIKKLFRNWYVVRERHLKDMTSDWPTSWTQALGFSFLLALLFPQLLQGHSLDIVMWCSEHLHSIHDWTQLRHLYKLLRSGWQVQDPFILLSSKTKLCVQVPLLSKTATYQSASFFGPFLTLYAGQQGKGAELFHITPGNLLRGLWTNICFLYLQLEA